MASSRSRISITQAYWRTLNLALHAEQPMPHPVNPLPSTVAVGHARFMAISEAQRSDLYTGLSEMLGSRRAEILMGAIPLHDLDEVATKGDLAVLRAEMAEMRSELKTELADLRAELKTDMAELRSELKSDIADYRSEVITELADFRKSMMSWLITALVAIIAALVAVAFAA